MEDKPTQTDWVSIEASLAWSGPAGYKAYLEELLADVDERLRYAEEEFAIRILQGQAQILTEVIRTPEAAATLLRRNAEDTQRGNNAARNVPRRTR